MSKPIPLASEVEASLQHVAGLVASEVRMAASKFGPDYASAHEAFGVLLEEVEEFKDWVWKKRNERDRVAMVEELVQVAAVATKYAAQLKREADANYAALRAGRDIE